MQGIKAWAAANPPSCRRRSTPNPSYVFFRELPADRRPDRRARRAAHAELQPGGRPALRAARRAGLPRDHLSAVGRAARAPDGGAGHRRRDPRRGARATSSGEPAPRPARRPAACASRAGCGCCGRAASRCRARSSSAVLEQLVRSAAQAAADALAVGEEQRRRAVDAELAAELEHLVDRVGAARPPLPAPWAAARASSSQALARSGEHHTACEWSAFSRPDHRVHEDIDGDVVDLAAASARTAGTPGSTGSENIASTRLPLPRWIFTAWSSGSDSNLIAFSLRSRSSVRSRSVRRSWMLPSMT